MSYVRDIREVVEVEETIDLNRVNDLIRKGWMLLGVVTPNNLHPGIVKFSLGKFPAHVDMSN